MAQDHKSWADKLTIGRLVALEGLYLKRMSEPGQRPARAEAPAAASRKPAQNTESLREIFSATPRHDVEAVMAAKVETPVAASANTRKRDFVALVR